MSGRETSGKRDGLNKLLPVAAVKKNANTRFMLSAILDMDEAVSVKELPGNGLNFTALPYKKHGFRRKTVSVFLPYLRPDRTGLCVSLPCAGAGGYVECFKSLIVGKI